MKNETYRKAFDNLNVPADMAERIRRAAAEEPAPQKVVEFRRPRRVWRAAAICACAAAMGLLVWKAGLLPQRADKASSLDSGISSEESQSSASGSAGDSVGSTPDTGAADAGNSSAGKTGEAAKTPAKSKSAQNAETPWEKTSVGSAASDKNADQAQTVPEGGGEAADGALNAAPPVTLPSGENTLMGSQVANPVEVVSAPSDLAGKLNFTPVLPVSVPEGWQVLSCAVIDGDTAQIVYADPAGNEACWRTAQGSADISGDSTVYPQTTETDGVTCRGDGETVSAAGWTADGMTFSLTFNPGVTAENAQTWVSAVKG